MKKIVLTGGGTAGHVTPNIALLPGLRERGLDIFYMGSFNGIEKTLMTQEGVRYEGVNTGKFRRNFDKQNLKDISNVFKGARESLEILKREKPDVLFSKGGFVSVPVVRAAHKLGIPVIIHESDMTPGLANKLCYTSAQKICCNFPETMHMLPKKKAVLSGSPIRNELLQGSREEGLKFTGLSADKPVLLMMGGSLGARKLNEILRASLDTLLQTFHVVHLCGKGNLDETLNNREGYRQYEYISKELPDLFAMADVIFSRSGANAICEFLALKKPMLLVPLPKDASRGDQILNAISFDKQGFAKVLFQEDLTPEALVETVSKLYENRDAYQEAMKKAPASNGVDVILGLIDEILG